MAGKRKYINREVAPRALDFIDKKPSPMNTRPLQNDKVAVRMVQFNKLLEELEQAVTTRARIDGTFIIDQQINELRMKLRRFVRTIK